MAQIPRARVKAIAILCPMECFVAPLELPDLAQVKNKQRKREKEREREGKEGERKRR